MKRIFNKCVCGLIIVSFISTFLIGLYSGFSMGKDSVCGDIAFYYNNDLPVKACVATNNLKKKEVLNVK